MSFFVRRRETASQAPMSQASFQVPQDNASSVSNGSLPLQYSCHRLYEDVQQTQFQVEFDYEVAVREVMPVEQFMDTHLADVEWGLLWASADTLGLSPCRRPPSFVRRLDSVSLIAISSSNTDELDLSAQGCQFLRGKYPMCVPLRGSMAGTFIGTDQVAAKSELLSTIQQEMQLQRGLVDPIVEMYFVGNRSKSSVGNNGTTNIAATTDANNSGVDQTTVASTVAAAAITVLIAGLLLRRRRRGTEDDSAVKSGNFLTESPRTMDDFDVMEEDKEDFQVDDLDMMACPEEDYSLSSYVDLENETDDTSDMAVQGTDADPQAASTNVRKNSEDSSSFKTAPTVVINNMADHLPPRAPNRSSRSPNRPRSLKTHRKKKKKKAKQALRRVNSRESISEMESIPEEGAKSDEDDDDGSESYYSDDDSSRFSRDQSPAPSWASSGSEQATADEDEAPIPSTARAV